MPKSLQPEAGAVAELELDTRRSIYGPSSGRWGGLIFADPTQPGVGISSPPFEDMLGGLLGTGGRVKITIEVLDPGTLTESTWDPSIPWMNWEEWEAYVGRGAARIFHKKGGKVTKADRLQGIRPANAEADQSVLGVRWSEGYGGGWLALDDIDGIEILTGDDASLQFVLQHKLPHRVVGEFSDRLPWTTP